ncbi:hypothetical protein BDF20DRAFT_910618 [Mycotypha africana]|uniref:uncharacterized protein n=1 Tax=Mycotypha africana TaxID=64632 RepID=UPI0023007D1C|nr:uncharacterized protein BDF20DRAFT_910618 [Mycotypha africana]KAI8988079.1 hypothetical protein BDF20DRAFT_910618 [Mycotypha africana]
MTTLILIDFDETMTIEDTIAPLGSFAVNATNNSHPWSWYSDEYMKDYYAHQATLTNQPKNFGDFVKQLDSYHDVEQASLDRVGTNHVFKGLSHKDLYEAGVQYASKKKIVQPYLFEALEPYLPQMRIISLNWSKDWLLGILKGLDVQKKDIYSNDLVFKKKRHNKKSHHGCKEEDKEDEEVATGIITPEILTTGDKQHIIKKIKHNKRVIYIGDSTGDIEALVEADIGIVIGNNTSLLKQLQRFHYSLEEDITKPSSLYRVDNWKQIKTILDNNIQ